MGHSLALYGNWILSTSEAPSKLGETGERGGRLGGRLECLYHTPGSPLTFRHHQLVSVGALRHSARQAL